MNPLLTPEEVAEILKISPRTVNELCNRKKLRFIQVDGKHRRFTEEMVQEFIQAQSAPAKQPVKQPVKPKPAKVQLADIKKELDSWQ